MKCPRCGEPEHPDQCTIPVQPGACVIPCPRCHGAGKVTSPAGIAARVVFFREARGLTRPEVEKGAGIAHSEYWRIENGKITDPSLKTVIALAKFFNITTDALLGVG